MRGAEDSGGGLFFFWCMHMRGLSLGERQTIERLVVQRKNAKDKERVCVCVGGGSDYIL